MSADANAWPAVLLYSIIMVGCSAYSVDLLFFFFQAEDGIRDLTVTGVQTCALPISPYGITANNVCPGIVETALHSRVVEQFSAMQGQTVEEGWDFFRNRIPLHRFQTPRDLGEMVAFLASDRAKNITGATFNVDGGWEMH